MENAKVVLTTGVFVLFACLGVALFQPGDELLAITCFLVSTCAGLVLNNLLVEKK